MFVNNDTTQTNYYRVTSNIITANDASIGALSANNLGEAEFTIVQISGYNPKAAGIDILLDKIGKYVL